MHFSNSALAAITAFIGYAAGECEISQAIPPSDTDFDFSSSSLCKIQDKGIYTFSMLTRLVVSPTFSNEDVWAGMSQGTAFILYDDRCKIKGVYAQPECEIPYWLDSQWLDYDIKVTSINTDVGGARYRFAYGSGSYGVGEGDCHCDGKHNGGIAAWQECRCPFPFNGDGRRI